MPQPPRHSILSMRDEVLALFRELADLSPDARARYFDEQAVPR